MDMCLIPAAFGLAVCCFGSSRFAMKSGRVSPEYDDERPRRMTPSEIAMYDAHMNAFGRHCNG